MARSLGRCRSSGDDQHKKTRRLVPQSALQMIKVGPPSSWSAVRDPPAQTVTEQKIRAMAVSSRTTLRMGPLHTFSAIVGGFG
jgi:hypothetical protein